MLFISCPNWGVTSSTVPWLYDACPHENAGANNGNLLKYDEFHGGAGHFSQTFDYDGLNRLKTATDSGGWSRSFDYDSYGNMWVPNASGPAPGAPSSNVYNANNRIVNAAYDAAGNLLAANGNALTYDAENRLTSATEPASLGGGTEQYLYDGDGRRVLKIGPAGSRTVFVYDAFGKLVADYSSTAPASPSPATYYLATDHLGSTRLVTDQNANVVSRHDFFPFGEEIPASQAGRGPQFGPGNDNVNQKFTGKEHDSESGLDYFGARYYGSSLGRFTSADPIWITTERLVDPQRLNLYAYGRNNPLKFTDPTGMDVALGNCPTSMTIASCQAAITDGLKKQDKSHVHFVKGDGKNGFAKGQWGIQVDKDHKSESKNFQVLQSEANDHTAMGRIDIYAPTDSFSVKTSFGEMSMQPGNPNNKSENSFEGYTFFPAPNGAGPWSTGSFTDVVINAGSYDNLAAVLHHELRHLFLGDFGRTAQRAAHSQEGQPKNDADRQTDAAFNEALQNLKER